MENGNEGEYYVVESQKTGILESQNLKKKENKKTEKREHYFRELGMGKNIKKTFIENGKQVTNTLINYRKLGTVEKYRSRDLKKTYN